MRDRAESARSRARSRERGPDGNCVVGGRRVRGDLEHAEPLNGGCRLRSARNVRTRRSQRSLGTTLPAGRFYLLGGSGYAGAATADQSFAAGLAGTGGGVGIRDTAGVLVDSVGWGTAANALVEASPAPAPPATAAPGSSIARIPDGHDTNANAADFTVSSSATPRGANK